MHFSLEWIVEVPSFFLQADYVHLYHVRLRCKDGSAPSNLVICDCSEMETARAFTKGLEVVDCTAQGSCLNYKSQQK
jgi:hypothetical protein